MSRHSQLNEATMLEAEDLVLSEWRDYTREVIGRLPVSCEWRWVAQQLERALSAVPPV